MNKAIDALSVLLLLGAAAAFWLGIIALGDHRDAVSIYWLVVGGLVLYASTELLRPEVRLEMTRAACAGLLLTLLSCGAEREAELVNARLAPGVAARVGPEEIAASSVAAIAEAEHVIPAVARGRAISDALLALEARRSLGDTGYARVAERAAQARALLTRIKAESAAQGPATDAEVDALTAARWQDFDRPETVRVTHAVVRVSSPEQDAEARAVAQRIHAAVRAAHDPDEFIRLAQSVEHGTLDVRAERLPAMTADGRGYLPEGQAETGTPSFDRDFAKAAFTLAAAGALSEPIKTRFGYHVLWCEARIPEQRVPLDVRRRVMQDEIFKQRAERSKDSLLAELNRGTPIQLARAAEDLTARVKVAE